MLLNLVIAELEHLQPIGECSLSGPSLCKVVDHFLVREGLLDVAVRKVDNGVAGGPDFSAYAVAKDNFFFAIVKKALDLAIMGYDLIHLLML